MGQRTLSGEVETREFGRLAAEFAALPLDHRERRLFPQVDKFSSVWVSSVPDAIGRLDPEGFREVFARYLFLPSPALRPYVGREIRSGQRRQVTLCGPYGDELATANLHLFFFFKFFCTEKPVAVAFDSKT